MIRLIAIDLDGTLFNSQQQITPTNKQAVQRAFESGVRIAIVTGRGCIGAERALEMLDMDLPYVCSAGSLAREGRQGPTLYTHSFHRPKDLRHLFDFSRRSGVGLVADLPEGYAIWFGPDSMNAAMDPMSASDARNSRRTLDPEKELDRPILKITAVAEMELLQQVEQLVRENCPALHQTYSGLRYIDMTAQGVNKGTALKALAEHWKLEPGEIAAIGDQEIDIEMLKFSGLPVAMANAVEPLQRAAKWIAPSNDEDGVAWALDEIVRSNRLGHDPRVNVRYTKIKRGHKQGLADS